MHFVIFIVTFPDGQTAFVPQGGTPGQALAMKVGDSVHWANDTNFPHLPWPFDATGQFAPQPFAPQLSVPMPPHTASVAVVMGPGPPGGYTVSYGCRLDGHQNEVGAIVVT